jgi:uncharacterized protein (DUF58 family)
LCVLLSIVPLALVARYLRIYPHRVLLWLAALGAVLSVALAIPGGPIYESAAWIVVALYDAAIVALAAVDVFLVPRESTFAIERETGKAASLRKTHPVSLCLTNRSGRGWLIAVKDDVAEDLCPKPEDFYLRLGPRTRTTVQYEVKPARRGAFTLRKVFLKSLSRLHLWKRFFEYQVESTLHVYPDMKQLSEYAVLARKNRLNLLGVRRTRRVGLDNEFERLRDFTRDDNYKYIEWRTTARRRKLTVKDFQTSQSQTLIFLIDCGRMMTNQASGLSLLDHALNSMLMLSYVALSRGDTVGLITFSDAVHGFVPPKGGASQMNRLLHASFDRFPQLVESRYDQAFLYLKSNVRKRSLVIFVSNVIDDVNAHQVHRYLCNLVGRHLPLGVLLRDHQLFDAVEVAHPHGQALFRAAAAADILTWRHQVIGDMHNRGVLTLDVFPEKLTAPLINNYLEIKARHLL